MTDDTRLDTSGRGGRLSLVFVARAWRAEMRVRVSVYRRREHGSQASHESPTVHRGRDASARRPKQQRPALRAL